jgi:hypothetical protein
LRKFKAIPKLNQSQVELIWNNVLKGAKDACWQWTGDIDCKGYGRMCLDKSRYKAHRLVLATVGRRSDLQVRHLCNTPSCVNPDHLEFGTYKEQYNDRRLAGTDNDGYKCVTSKLTEDNIKRIRELSGVQSQSCLASQFGVTQAHISSIVKRKVWKHI